MSKKETNSIHVISNIGKNELTISKEFIKKTAKNTLKHLKGAHHTLTLSELTEALSKGLGFNNFHAVKNTPEFPSFENIENNGCKINKKLGLYICIGYKPSEYITLELV